MNHRYRKKPVEIEAFQMTWERRFDNTEWPHWLHEAWNRGRGVPGSLETVSTGRQPDGSLNAELQIVTLKGCHRVSWNDWIIRGVDGELCLCKPDNFAATYEPVR